MTNTGMTHCLTTQANISHYPKMEMLESAEKQLTLSTRNNNNNLCLLISMHIRRRIDLRGLSSSVNGPYSTVFKAAKSILVFSINLDVAHGGCDWSGDGCRRSVSSWLVSATGTCLQHGLTRSKVPKVPWSLPNREASSSFNVEL